jgi:hypothetical protein
VSKGGSPQLSFEQLTEQEVFLLRLALERVRFATEQLAELVKELDKGSPLEVGLASSMSDPRRPGGPYDQKSGWWDAVQSSAGDCG